MEVIEALRALALLLGDAHSYGKIISRWDPSLQALK